MPGPSLMKNIEKGNYGGKGSESHKTAVVGDTGGDPFKDTSGPSLNALIKLMTMVSVVMAGPTVALGLFSQPFFHIKYYHEPLRISGAAFHFP
jgi:hypothetical protein